MSRKMIIAAALAASLSANANAAERYEFDTVHSQVLFFVNHLGFSNSEGEFLEFGGDLLIDTEDLTQSTINVSIDTASIDMDDEGWDKHLKNEDFFDVDKYPAMTFKSSTVKQMGDKMLTVSGDLTILDVTRPVTLDVKVNKIGDHPFSKKPTVGFSATTTIKRSEFGINYALPAVGDDVEIRIEVEANKAE